MGVCVSVKKPKPNQIISHVSLSDRVSTENHGTLKPYVLYPYQIDVSAVEEMQRKYHGRDFVEYYLERANQQKNQRQSNERETGTLMIYEHPDISTKAPKNLKEELLKEIDSDSASVTLILDKGIAPNESIGKKGYGETMLHYVAKQNNVRILKAILKWIKAKRPAELDTYLNIPDVEGNTPVMVAAICDAADCVYAFFHTKGRIDIDRHNKAGLTLAEICKYFSTRSLEIVNRFNEGKIVPLMDADEKIEETAPKSLVGNLVKQETIKEVEEGSILKAEESKPAENILSKRPEASMTVEDLQLTYQQILDNLSGTGAEFLDSEFYESLIREHREDPIIWKRDYEILEKKKGAVKLLGNVSPYDILEGPEWTKMMTVIQALACFPSVIRSVFNTKESNPQGLYSLTLYKNGIPQEVLINNMFPVDSETNKPRYFRTVGKKFWTNVLGKAMAKLYGSYTQIDKAQGLTLFGNITPAPVWMIEMNDSIDDYLLIENMKKMISPHTVTYLYSDYSCNHVTDGIKPGTLYQLLEIKSISNTYIVVGKNFDGHDEKMFKTLEELQARGLPVDRYNGFDEKAIESGVFPLRVSQLKKLIESIYIIPKMLDGKYTYIPIVIEENHAEYFEIEITTEVKGWFRFTNRDPEEAILIQDYDTNPKLSCKFLHCNCY